MPIIQIDWQKIKSKLGDVTALYALTHRQASLLSSLAEQLKWDKTFRVNDYDFSDRDELEADISDLELQLQMPTNLVDIIQYIDEIEDLLRALQGVTSCCDGEDITGGDQYTDPIIDGEGDVPQNIIDAGYAEDSEDWEGFASYKCMISHLMVLQLEYRLRKLATLADESGDILGGAAAIISVVVTIFSIVITGVLTPIALGILASTGTAAILWKAITDATNLDDLADEVDENHDDLACSIYFSDGSEDAIASLKSKIDDLFTGSSAIILKNLNIDATLKALYSGGYGDQDIADIIATTGYSTDDFDCACEDYQWGEHLYEYTFDSSAGNFTGNMHWDSSGELGYMHREGTQLGYVEINPSYMCNELGLPDTQNIRIRRMGYKYQHTNATTYARVDIIRTTGGDYGFQNTPLSQYEYHEVVINFDQLELDMELDYNDQIRVGLRAVTGGDSQYVDNFWCEFDELG